MNVPNLPWLDGYRVFLSHESSIKGNLHLLKDSLADYGISAFVAHEDISPTAEWQEVIRSALLSMDAFVALVTKKFHQSLWTDQEIGYALCRGIKIIPVKVDGTDPYGFIAKFQGLSCKWTDMPIEIVKLLIDQPDMTTAYINALHHCESFDQGNRLAQLLEYIGEITSEQAEGLIRAFNKNPEIGGSYGFNGERPTQYGIGLAKHLNRLTGKTYRHIQDNGYGYSKIYPE